jgi:hypothetical protein
MPTCRIISAPQLLNDGSHALCFQQVDPTALANEAAVFFAQQEYKFEGGDALKSTWGQGSDTARILLGGFAKRYQFVMSIEPQAGTPYVWLRFSKGISGAMGGVLGYSKMNKEHARMVDALTRYFSS